MNGSTEIRVRYQETDRMGVAYHANYFVWMEVGRTELFREQGIAYRDLEDKGIMLPVIKAYCEHELPVYYDEKIRVHTEITELTPVKVTCEYTLFKDSGEKAASGYTVHAFMGTDRKAINVAKQEPDIYLQMQGRSKSY